MAGRSYSNREIEELGKRLGENETPSQEDVDLLQEYRKSFSEALPAVFEIVKMISAKADERSIVTFRIKRIDTIIGKLQRFARQKEKGTMTLKNMGDIAGCRCILNTLEEKKIFDVANGIRNIVEIKERSHARDYIDGRDDGYKSYHMYVQHKDFSRQVEIQIRNKEMHSWATLVEIIDFLYNYKIKEGNKDNDLQEFLYLYSQKKNLTAIDKDRLIQIETKRAVFETMSKRFVKNYAQVRTQWAKRRIGENYLVIEAGKNYDTTLSAFDNFEEAETFYYKSYLENRDTNIVLIYASNSDFRQISFAYSNYILSIHDFFWDYKDILERRIIDCVHAGNIDKLKNILKIYRNIVLIYHQSKKEEETELKKITSENISKRFIAEWASDIKADRQKYKPGTDLFLKNLRAAVSRSSKRKKFEEQFRPYFRLLDESIRNIKNPVD